MMPPAELTDYSLGPALDFLERLWALNHALESLSGHMAVHLGVTAQQRLVLRCLGKYPGLSAGRLASLLHVDPGTISASLKRLESKELIVRHRDPNDQRRVVLKLSPKGRTMDRLTPGTVEHAVEKLLKVVSSTELAITVQVLERLTRELLDEISV